MWVGACDWIRFLNLAISTQFNRWSRQGLFFMVWLIRYHVLVQLEINAAPPIIVYGIRFNSENFCDPLWPDVVPRTHDLMTSLSLFYVLCLVLYSPVHGDNLYLHCCQIIKHKLHYNIQLSHSKVFTPSWK